MKIVHVMTDFGAIKADKEVPDNYQLQANESVTLPAIPAYAPDYQPIKVDINAADPEQMMLSQLALQQAQFQASQQKINSQLALQLAQITAKEAQNV